MGNLTDRQTDRQTNKQWDLHVRGAGSVRSSNDGVMRFSSNWGMRSTLVLVYNKMHKINVVHIDSTTCEDEEETNQS